MIVEVPRAVCTSINGLECAARTSSYLHTHSADRALCIPPIDATYGMLARSSRVARQARLLVRASPSIRRSCSYAARWIIFLAPFELFLRCKITLSCTNSASCGQYSLRSLSVRITGESGKYGLRLAVPSRKQNNTHEYELCGWRTLSTRAGLLPRFVAIHAGQRMWWAPLLVHR